MAANIDAALEVARAFSTRTAGPVLGHLLLALIDITAGIVALVWPGPTALVPVIVVAVWALISGFFELAAMLDTCRRPAGARATCPS